MPRYNAVTSLSDFRPETRALNESQLRVELAAAYRIFDYLGWTQLIYGHITARVPGQKPHFLINPFGLMYHEVTASNLVKVDLTGKIIGDSEYPVNPAGFTIHSAVHGAREDVCCVMHSHTTAGMAVAATADGLKCHDFAGISLHDRIAYHDFEGVTVDLAERERLSKNLGEKNLKNMGNSFSVFQISPSSDIEEESTNGFTIDATLNKKLRLCVLPFRNLNSNNENEDFIDGIVEDITTEFSLINSIEVISTAAAFSFKGKDTHISEIQKHFHVDFILSGSIRSSGQRVRVSVELLATPQSVNIYFV